MQFDYTFKGSTAVVNRLDQTDMFFAPDVRRDPVYFSGELRQSLAFREGISALHDVVTSDLRYRAKDRSAYEEWAATQETIDWQRVAAQRRDVRDKIRSLQKELSALEEGSRKRRGPYYEALSRFRAYAWRNHLAISSILDPVITVHPDEVFFECFSRDESTYARLSAGYEVFKDAGEFACGTTNIDYSRPLYDEFQKIRTYKTTHFEIDPSGFDVQTSGEDAYKEVKVDLPDSWVRGFLQVSSAMSLPTTTLDLHPMDVHNLCFVLRRHKEKKGPRAMRYHLKPGEPVTIVFEPWETEVVCARSVYKGPEAAVIRTWGRRRILTLERLIPIATKFTAYLLGNGMPSFYVAALGDMSFTLGLSGWTANDWAGAANFDLMAPRATVDEFTKRTVFDALKERWFETPVALAARLGLDHAVVLGALGAYTQAGRAIYDLNKQVYRVRELSRELLPMEQLRFASLREESAERLLAKQAVRLTARNVDTGGVLNLRAQVQDEGKVFLPSVSVDGDERIVAAECTCNWHKQNKLYKGPCEHILAVRKSESPSVSGGPVRLDKHD